MPPVAEQRGPARPFLIAEFVFLFVALPVLLVALTMAGFRLVLPVMGIFTLYAFVILWRDPAFDRKSLYSLAPIKGQILPILALFIPGGLLLTAAVWWLLPDDFLSFPRIKPGIWALVMLLYPILSVYPQQVIYRAFFFHRYPMIHGGELAHYMVTSIAVFTFLHIVYMNWLAIALTFAGGIIFSYTWWRGRSVMACWLEHALWGNLVFTIGLGSYLYYNPKKDEVKPPAVPTSLETRATQDGFNSGLSTQRIFHTVSV